MTTNPFDIMLDLLGGPIPHAFDDTPDFGEPDLYVSDSEAAHMQRRYDAWLGEMWGAA